MCRIHILALQVVLKLLSMYCIYAILHCSFVPSQTWLLNIGSCANIRKRSQTHTHTHIAYIYLKTHTLIDMRRGDADILKSFDKHPMELTMIHGSILLYLLLSLKVQNLSSLDYINIFFYRISFKILKSSSTTRKTLSKSLKIIKKTLTMVLSRRTQCSLEHNSIGLRKEKREIKTSCII